MNRWQRLGHLALGVVGAIACTIVPAVLIRLGLRSVIATALATHPTVARMLGGALSLVVMIAGYWAFVHFFERRAVTELRVRLTSLVVSGLAGALMIGTVIALLFATGFNTLQAYRGFGAASDVLATIVVAATFEELVFRAILFRELQRYFGSGWAITWSAVIFGALHLANDGAGFMSMLSVTLLGILWCGIYLVSRNLWVCAINHITWNATIFVSGMSLSGSTEWMQLAPLQTVTTGPGWLTGGTFGPENSVIAIALIALANAALLIRVRQQRDHEITANPSTA